ncbi:hypothetical protein, partial [Vibrio ouci]|uniref:hypothetical protein n=1 Tax=Vibrio ouci TaxID=2499078 RepID=UPI001ABF655D
QVVDCLALAVDQQVIDILRNPYCCQIKLLALALRLPQLACTEHSLTPNAKLRCEQRYRLT